MKQIDIPYCPGISQKDGLEKVSSVLDDFPCHNIDIHSWPVFNYSPQTRFTIVHNGNCIFIKFRVIENYLKVTYHNSNDPVYNDSCVEFFISIDNDEEYYNFEFNCIGTCLSAFGTKMKNQRQYLPDAVINKIKRQSIIKAGLTTPQGLICWELTIALPIDVFYYHKIESLEGLNCRANFYKCGDALPEPHFVAWNEIKSDEPNFHLPEFFGKLSFNEYDLPALDKTAAC